MKLTVNTFLTLNGVMQAPGSNEEDASGGFTGGGWLTPHADPDLEQIVSEWYGMADALLLGRNTYDMMQPYWEAVTDPGDSIAAALNGLPKYLVSTTMPPVPWHNTHLLEGEVVASVERVKARHGGEVQVHGSYQLVQALAAAGLVDAYRLLIFPVVVGQGKRLFEDIREAASYSISQPQTTRSGAISVTLHPTVLRAGTGSRFTP
ncbi:dihydrofolate reductase family protein [Arthrobacter zhaoxinii]|uniref:dihydrofolate reductase family protein n=1 Tax=Arthrobacter zhaoxinii TaxID=2964616 RepID=UPI0021084618|nr:dihydrofolate reductase family protein [Arthrobacter zhaoxinii]MCQ1999787.1 dihydrofolate reductase family protein [Arthrobacter zhaoxinii]